jgi:hypothetical protein
MARADAASEAPMTLDNRIALLQQRLTAFNAQWSSLGVSDDKMTPSFVADIISSIVGDVILPFMNFKIAAAEQLSNVFVTSQIAAVSETGLTKYWTNGLRLVLLDAIKRREAGEQTMVVVVPGARTPDKGLRWHLNAIMVEVIYGYKELARLESIKPWFLQMGTLTDLAMQYLVSAGAKVVALANFVAGAGAALFAPIDAIKKALDLTVKLSAVAAVGWILWKTRKPSTGRRALRA